MQEALKAVERGNASGADVLEIRLDLYKDFSSEEDLKALMEACKLPYIVTYRPLWEGCGACSEMCTEHGDKVIDLQ